MSYQTLIQALSGHPLLPGLTRLDVAETREFLGGRSLQESICLRSNSPFYGPLGVTIKGNEYRPHSVQVTRGTVLKPHNTVRETLGVFSTPRQAETIVSTALRNAFFRLEGLEFKGSSARQSAVRDSIMMLKYFRDVTPECRVQPVVVMDVSYRRLSYISLFDGATTHQVTLPAAGNPKALCEYAASILDSPALAFLRGNSLIHLRGVL